MKEVEEENDGSFSSSLDSPETVESFSMALFFLAGYPSLRMSTFLDSVKTSISIMEEREKEKCFPSWRMLSTACKHLGLGLTYISIYQLSIYLSRSIYLAIYLSMARTHLCLSTYECGVQIGIQA